MSLKPPKGQAMNGNVLLVDDEPNILSSLSRSLRKEPYRVHTATSGAAALQILETESIDVIVCDQDMPGMKGTELLWKVHVDYPDTIRFILTGKATLDIALEAINKGAVTRFFTKPCHEFDLIVSIRQALRQRELLLLARKLLHRIRRQNQTLKELEKSHPGIGHVHRDHDGSILLEETPENYEDVVKKIHEVLSE